MHTTKHLAFSSFTIPPSVQGEPAATKKNKAKQNDDVKDRELWVPPGQKVLQNGNEKIVRWKNNFMFIVVNQPSQICKIEKHEPLLFLTKRYNPHRAESSCRGQMPSGILSGSGRPGGQMPGAATGGV